MSLHLTTKGTLFPPESKISKGILAKQGLFEVVIAKLVFIRDAITRTFGLDKIVRVFTREKIK